jgi:hypothetical protein
MPKTFPVKLNSPVTLSGAPLALKDIRWVNKSAVKVTSWRSLPDAPPVVTKGPVPIARPVESSLLQPATTNTITIAFNKITALRHVIFTAITVDVCN